MLNNIIDGIGGAVGGLFEGIGNAAGGLASGVGSLLGGLPGSSQPSQNMQQSPPMDMGQPPNQMIDPKQFMVPRSDRFNRFNDMGIQRQPYNPNQDPMAGAQQLPRNPRQPSEIQRPIMNLGGQQRPKANPRAGLENPVFKDFLNTMPENVRDKFVNRGMTLSPQGLQKIFPNADPKIVKTLTDSSDLLKEYGIDTPQRMRHFLAQMGHESGNFKYLKELGSPGYFNKYEGRKSLGNTQPGDGARYKGRGIIQLTGRYNYKKYGDKLGIDLVNNPELASNPDVALRIAAQYWKDKGLNKLADNDDLRGITKRINGGHNGLRHRQKLYTNLGGMF
jgi:predicted chitinase